MDLMNTNSSDGSTELVAWDTIDEANNQNHDNHDDNSLHEDSSSSYEEDDPAIIQMQMNEMRKRGLVSETFSRTFDQIERDHNDAIHNTITTLGEDSYQHQP